MEIEKIIKKVGEIVKKHAGSHVRVLLFGSHAQGTETATSDLDIALDAGDVLSFETLIKIKEDVSEIPTLRSIDIVDLHSAGDKLRTSITNSSKEICMK